MALSFATGHLTLSTWGFGAGDIAVLAGAGRAVGTWVMNQIKDQALLQFMRVDPEDLIPRKGLIDTTALHQRWDVRLTLLHNGDRRVIGGNSGPLIESMGIFSWFMTLITSALDATFQKNSMKLAMSSLLTVLFEEHVDGLDYIQRELPHHIQGWMSAAVVRNIVAKSRDVWQSTLEQKLRLPGYIPEGDINEVVRFLVWLAGAKGQTSSKRFDTTSSDVFAFAIILQSLGMDLMEIPRGNDITDFAESKLVVKYTPGAMTTTTATEEEVEKLLFRNKQRSGMRIPLEYPEECVSLWPGGAGANNQRRQLFKDGVAACRTLEIGIDSGKEADEYISMLVYTLYDPTMSSVGRTEPVVFRLVTDYFPIATPYILENMSTIVSQNPGWGRQHEWDIVDYLRTSPAALSKVQVFVLGYYYAMLQKVIDISRLSVPEAYGSWKWFDINLLSTVKDILIKHSHMPRDDPDIRLLYREGLFKLLALLVVGAEKDQLREIDRDTIGVHGRISAVSSSLLGAVNSHACAMQFCLLDTDSTAIPSNVRGIVKSGRQPRTLLAFHDAKDDTLQNLEDVDPAGLGEDFTSHIEPDWDNDVQLCQVVFRFKGRVIERLAPNTIESAWSKQIVQTKLIPLVKSDGTQEPLKVQIGKLVQLRLPQNFLNPASNVNQSPLLFQTRGFVKARTCLVAVYHMRGLIRIEVPNSWPVVRCETDSSSADETQRRILLHPDPKGETLRPWLCVILA
jgi:hypothetical protein